MRGDGIHSAGAQVSVVYAGVSIVEGCANDKSFQESAAPVVSS